MSKKLRICCGISTACFCCKLETLGCVVGCLGAIYRIMLIVTFSILLSMLTDYDPNLYELVFGIILAYSVVSFITSGMLLIGIFKRIHLFFIPYLSVELLEILFIILLSLLRSFLMYFLGNQNDLYWFIPLMIFTACE
nr:uncharacterized protein LOC111428241 [Onthophagus taurus]